MRGWLFLLIGLLLLVMGAVWTLQGVGTLQGSPMTDQTLWAVVGPVVAVVGLVLLALGARAMRRGSPR